MLKDYLGIKVHTEDPPFLSELGRAILSDGYVKENEAIPEAFARASTAFCGGDYALAQRIYDAVYNNHFMFATPIITNAPKGVFVNGYGTYTDSGANAVISKINVEENDNDDWTIEK